MSTRITPSEHPVSTPQVHEFEVERITIFVEGDTKDEATQRVSDILDEFFADWDTITYLGPLHSYHSDTAKE